MLNDEQKEKLYKLRKILDRLDVKDEANQNKSKRIDKKQYLKNVKSVYKSYEITILVINELSNLLDELELSLISNFILKIHKYYHDQISSILKYQMDFFTIYNLNIYDSSPHELKQESKLDEKLINFSLKLEELIKEKPEPIKKETEIPIIYHKMTSSQKKICSVEQLKEEMDADKDKQDIKDVDEILINKNKELDRVKSLEARNISALSVLNEVKNDINKNRNSNIFYTGHDIDEDVEENKEDDSLKIPYMKRSNKSKPSVSFDASVFQPKSNQEINETDITSAISDKIERKDTFSYKSRVKLSTHDLRVTIKTNKTKNSYTEPDPEIFDVNKIITLEIILQRKEIEISDLENMLKLKENSSLEVKSGYSLLKRDINNLKMDIESLNTKIAEQNLNEANLQIDINNLKKINNLLKSEIGKYENLLEGKENYIDDINVKIEIFKKDIHDKETEISILKEKNSRLNQAIEKYNNDLNEKNTINNDIILEKNRISSELDTLKLLYEDEKMNNEEYIIKLLKQIENFNEKTPILTKLNEKEKIASQNQINSNFIKKKNTRQIKENECQTDKYLLDIYISEILNNENLNLIKQNYENYDKNIFNPNQNLIKNKLIDLDNDKNSYNNNNFDKNDKNSFYQKIALKFKENLNSISNENYSNNTNNINDMNSSNKESITNENNKKSSKILKTDRSEIINLQKSQEFKQNLQKFFEFEDPNQLSSKSRHLKALSTFESSKNQSKIQENQEIIDSYLPSLKTQLLDIISPKESFLSNKKISNELNNNQLSAPRFNLNKNRINLNKQENIEKKSQKKSLEQRNIHMRKDNKNIFRENNSTKNINKPDNLNDFNSEIHSFQEIKEDSFIFPDEKIQKIFNLYNKKINKINKINSQNNDNPIEINQNYSDFKNFLLDFMEIHKKCGKNCQHLKRFYDKIGWNEEKYTISRLEIKTNKTIINNLPKIYQK